MYITSYFPAIGHLVTSQLDLHRTWFKLPALPDVTENTVMLKQCLFKSSLNILFLTQTVAIVFILSAGKHSLENSLLTQGREKPL